MMTDEKKVCPYCKSEPRKRSIKFAGFVGFSWRCCNYWCESESPRRDDPEQAYHDWHYPGRDKLVAGLRKECDEKRARAKKAEAEVARLRNASETLERIAKRTESETVRLEAAQVQQKDSCDLIEALAGRVGELERQVDESWKSTVGNAASIGENRRLVLDAEKRIKQLEQTAESWSTVFLCNRVAALESQMGNVQAAITIGKQSPSRPDVAAELAALGNEPAQPDPQPCETCDVSPADCSGRTIPFDGGCAEPEPLEVMGRVDFERRARHPNGGCWVMRSGQSVSCVDERTAKACLANWRNSVLAWAASTPEVVRLVMAAAAKLGSWLGCDICVNRSVLRSGNGMPCDDCLVDLGRQMFEPDPKLFVKKGGE